MRKIALLFLFLLAANASADDASYHTPLYEAALSGDLQKVKELVGKGANIEERNGDPEMWDEYGSFRSSENDRNAGVTPIYGAIYGKHVDVINFLVQSGADLNAVGTSRFDESVLIAAAECVPQLFGELIRHGARAGYMEGLTLLVLSHEKFKKISLPLFQITFIKDMVEYRKNFDVETNRIILKEFNNKMLTDLLEQIMFSKRFHPVYYAGDIFINLEAVQLLVNLGADVNYIMSEGYTFLHRLASSESFNKVIVQNRIDVINILVSKGANLHAQDRYGRKPFELLATVPKIVKALKV